MLLYSKEARRMDDSVKLTNNAPFLLKLIISKKLSPKTLTKHQRRICVRYLISERKYTQNEIAEILQVNFRTVSDDKCKIIRDNKWMLKIVDDERYAVHMMAVAEVASARLFKQGKNREAWQVEKECFDLLQDLGYISKKPIKFEGLLSLQEALRRADALPPPLIEAPKS